MAESKEQISRGTFYDTTAEIGKAVGRLDLADKAWEIAVQILRDMSDSGASLSHDKIEAFLAGEYGQAFALTVVSRFPRGVIPAEITDMQLRESIMESFMCVKLTFAVN